MLKKVLCAILALCMVFAFIGCSAQEEAPKQTQAPAATEKAPAADAPVAEAPKFEKQTITFNFDQAETSIMGQGVAKFKELVEAKTDGQVTVEVHYNGTLFNQGSQFEATIKGSCDLILNAISNAASYVPDLQVAFAPYLWADFDHWNNFWTGTDGQALLDQVADEVGIRYLAWFSNGQRDVELNIDRKIASRKDMADIKLRAVPEASYQFLVESLGASPVPIGLADAYLSIETGVVDGLEIPVSDLFGQGLQDVVKSVTRTGHMMQTIGFIVSEKQWQSWSPELQQVVQEAANEAAAYTTELGAVGEGESIAKLEAAGVKVYTLTAEEAAALRQEVIDWVMTTENAESWNMELYQKMIDAAN